MKTPLRLTVVAVAAAFSLSACTFATGVPGLTTDSEGGETSDVKVTSEGIEAPGITINSDGSLEAPGIKLSGEGLSVDANGLQIAPPQGASTASCDNDDFVVRDEGTRLILKGDCADVVIKASDVTVYLESADEVSFTRSSGQSRVIGRQIGALNMFSNKNQIVSGSSIKEMSISADSNENNIYIGGDAKEVAFYGSNNAVYIGGNTQELAFSGSSSGNILTTGGTLGSVDDYGDGNRFIEQ